MNPAFPDHCVSQCTGTRCASKRETSLRPTPPRVAKCVLRKRVCHKPLSADMLCALCVMAYLTLSTVGSTATPAFVVDSVAVGDLGQLRFASKPDAPLSPNAQMGHVVSTSPIRSLVVTSN